MCVKPQCLALRNACSECTLGLLRVLHYQSSLLSTLGERRVAVWGEVGPGVGDVQNGSQREGCWPAGEEGHSLKRC